MWQAERHARLVFAAPERLVTTMAVPGPEEPPALSPDQLPALLNSAESLHVLLGGHCLRSTTLPWSDSLATQAGMTAYAEARWRQAFGDSADWALVVEPGPFEGSSMLLGLPRPLEQSLRGSPAATLLVQPLVTAACAHFARKLPADCLFGVLEPGCLMLAVVERRHIRQLSRHRIGQDWRQEVVRVHRRLLLQDPALAAAGPIQLLALTAGGDAGTLGDAATLLPWPAPGIGQSLMLIAAGMRASAGFNLLPPRSRRSRLERAALVLAAAIFAVTASGWLHTAHNDAEATPLVDTTPAPTPPDEKDQQALAREVAVVNRTVTALNLPADAVVAAVAPGQLKEVALLGIELGNAGDGKVRVTASAHSIAGMESYLHLLEQRPQLRAVSLTHHEIGGDAEWPYRFVLEAQWQTP